MEVKQKERKLSEAEIKSQERDTKKKELKEKQKKLYGTITNFIKAIFVFKEIKPLKPDLELYKAIVEVMVKVNAQSTESDLTQLYIEDKRCKQQSIITIEPKRRIVNS